MAYRPFACSNRLKIRLWPSGIIPIPLSETANSTQSCGVLPVALSPEALFWIIRSFCESSLRRPVRIPRSVNWTLRLTLPPSGVNLTTLDNRLFRICLSMRSSAMIVSGMPTACELTFIPFPFAFSRIVARQFFRTCFTLTAECCRSSLRASTLERTKISLIRSSRCRLLF